MRVALADGDLRSRQPYPRRDAHRLDHIVNQALNLRCVRVTDRFRFLAQDGFVGANDVSNGHVGFKGGFCFFVSSLLSLRTAW